MLIAATTSIHSGKAVQHFRKAHRLLGPQRGSEHHHLGKGTPRSSSPCLCCALHCRAFREGKIRSPGSSVWFPHCFLFKSPFSQSQAYFFPLLLTLWFFGPFLPLGKKKKTWRRGRQDPIPQPGGNTLFWSGESRDFARLWKEARVKCRFPISRGDTRTCGFS